MKKQGILFPKLTQEEKNNTPCFYCDIESKKLFKFYDCFLFFL